MQQLLGRSVGTVYDGVKCPIIGYLSTMSTTKRYYFNVIKSSETVHDREGTDLPSLEAARAYAIEDARMLMSMAILEGHDISSREIEVTNDDGEVVLILPFREAFTQSERS
jgi:hypothetical protein